ncbi:cephalosporin hydroxylase [Bradyrhizobium sp. CIR18]|uniref:class I SAM-dependent methyltransferase n=1 Tax=Bradyrhizobium sp. CIR18 TaxID=2663839 RepID=UPI001605B28B|nr:class I SAM-dependent methyltransferase [Bradyrhizobium sp. CIR18]MBB4361497.1 cephalosporin hydroxylase [Bradyrhizobium sp. CIR18]
MQLTARSIIRRLGRKDKKANATAELEPALRASVPGRIATTEIAPSWPDPVRNSTASEFEVDLWTLSSFLLEKIVPVVGTHPYPLNELLLMTAAACRLKPSVVFDWGTHIGVSARIFYECDQAFELGYEIHSIDLPPDVAHVEHPGQEHGRLVRGIDKVHLHRGNGVKVALDQWEKLGRPRRPLFFVDGDHAYESVRDELNEIFSAVPDASALAHDTFFQSAESNYNVGPARAVEEIMERFPSRFRVIKSGLGLPGMTLLATM